MKTTAWIRVFAVALLAVFTVHVGEAWARAGGGGSRGSRSYSAPARPAPASPAMPSSPSRNLNQPAPSPAASPFQRPSFFSGLMGGIAGFALGGLLGSLLFGGFGRGLGGGIGLFDLLLIGGGIALLVAFLRRRRTAPAPVPAYAGGLPGAYGSAYGTASAEPVGGPAAGGATLEMPAGQGDLDRGIAHIQQMDARFDPAAFGVVARNAFLEVQQAVAARDVSWLADRLTPEVRGVLQSQCDQLRASGRTNHIERIQVRRADLTEAWQETGRDFVTVLVNASMIDYVTDDATGTVVEGSRTAAQDVEEFWTFVRPVGNNPWQLSAIQRA